MIGAPVIDTDAEDGDLVTATASCGGQVVLGGGVVIAPQNAGDTDDLALLASYPSTAGEWTATVAVVSNFSNDGDLTVTAYALCSQ